MALLRPDESYATQISWWPLVSVLGTFSAGKSSFLNHFIGQRLQRTGNNAVDDKFTVICHGEGTPSSGPLPGVALDADPRFPFFRMSEELDRVSPGEGQRIDAYLQMATSTSERLKGKILIDSPGFDADAQRDEVLRIVEHIMGLSDLVIVMFDARHPEPGAMRDTLKHLVEATSRRVDPSKFMFVLNQIDTAAGEDNIEDIVAAWQRALASSGLTAGRFFTIYNPDAAVEITDPQLRARLQRQCSKNLGEIHRRINEVELGRAYRIVAQLENTASRLEKHAVPRLTQAVADWRSKVLTRTAIGTVAGLALGVVAAGLIRGWENVIYYPDWWDGFISNGWLLWPAILAAVGILVWLHFWNRRTAANAIAARLDQPNEARPAGAWVGSIEQAFRRSTHSTRPLFAQRPAGWKPRHQRRVATIKEETTRFVQTLNDHYGASPIDEAAAPAAKRTHERAASTPTPPTTAAPKAAPETAPKATPETAPKVAPETTPKAAPEPAPEAAPETPPRTATPKAPTPKLGKTRRATAEPKWAKNGFRKEM